MTAILFSFRSPIEYVRIKGESQAVRCARRRGSSKGLLPLLTLLYEENCGIFCTPGNPAAVCVVIYSNPRYDGGRFTLSPQKRPPFPLSPRKCPRTEQCSSSVLPCRAAPP